ncbi:MAG: lysophospholipid acyltransferase family protein [Chloroflexota bacterium]
MRLTAIEGLENVPRAGPVLVVSRHFHHLYDGVVYLAILRRQVHILVALDWVSSPRLRWLMEPACSVAELPVVLRRERLRRARGSGYAGPKSAYRATEAGKYLRRGLRFSVSLLRRGRLLVIFPEAYPNVDPIETPKTDAADFLPFRRGFVTLIQMAQRDGQTRVAVVPAGLRYRDAGSWHIGVRFAAPLYLESGDDPAAFTDRVEREVKALSV